jgi:hypothetical protein
MATTKKMKPLARMANSSKGPLHHIEIHPAQNSAGKQAFLTRMFRKPTPEAQAAADKMGKYLPESTQDGPDTAHEDGQDMVDHVGRMAGVQPQSDEDGDADDAPGSAD